MAFGYGRGGGFGRGAGMGYGFRGSSPPWPYLGRGRGGLPRCGYYAAPGAPVPYQPPVYSTGPATPGYTPYPAGLAPEDELDYLRNQAQAIKDQLDQIDSRMQELEKRDKKESGQ